MVKEFTATLQKSPAKGGWTYVVWPTALTHFGTRGLLQVRGTIDGHAFRSCARAQRDGWHMVPVTAGTRNAIGKQAGDDVTIRLEQRIEH